VKKEQNMQARLTTKPEHEVIAAIHTLDLEPVKLRMMDGESGKGWSREYADSVETEYKLFLTLLAKHPADIEEIPVSKDVDEFWHNHILHTLKYANDCQKVFGNFLHHNPQPVAHASKESRAAAYCNAAVQAHHVYCNATVRGKGTAYCNATVHGSEGAYCNATIKGAAYCNATVETRKAYCNATVHGAKAAYCNAGIKEAAYCNATTKADKTYCNATVGGEKAYCNASVRAVESAYCNATVEKAAYSYCNATAQAGKAYCNATVDSGESAYCNATIQANKAAYCNATAGNSATS
jgi:hypothetical protein